VIAIADAPRETSKDAVGALRELGVRPVMLTGDSRATAERVAAEIGIEEVIAPRISVPQPDVLVRCATRGHQFPSPGSSLSPIQCSQASDSIHHPIWVTTDSTRRCGPQRHR
jgi:magnesium-transporting ATPase (P-type)